MQNMNRIAGYCDLLWAGRSAVDALLDEIAGYAAPDRAGFASLKPSPSGEGRDKIWDSAPEDAALTLASSLHGLLTNPAADWLRLRLAGAGEDGGPAAQNFIRAAEKTLLESFADPAGGFSNEVNSFYLDLVCFGWAVFLAEWRDGAGLRFRAVPPAECAIAENADGRVDTVLRRFSMTPGQMLEEYGQEAMSDRARNLLEQGMQTPVRISHLVAPREKLPRDAFHKAGDIHPARAGRRASQPAFASIHFETETKQLLRSSSYHELPYMAPRWSKRSGEVYGRGPGHSCLPDMRVLNRVAFSQLVGGEKLADPPLVAASDSVIGKLRSHAGGITYIDPTQCLGGDPAAALRQLKVEYRLEVAEAILEKRRESIRSAFLNDRIQLAGGPQMTATEVLARERKQNLVLAPVLGRLENEFLGPLADRVFLLLLRNGRLFPPEELAGRELRARYVSPVGRAMRQGEAESFSRALAWLAPAAQAAPEILDNFDFDRAARAGQDLFGFPGEFMRNEATVAKLREERAQAAQAQAQAQAAQTV